MEGNTEVTRNPMSVPPQELDWDEVESISPCPGVTCKRIDTQFVTVFRYDLTVGATISLQDVADEHLIIGLRGTATVTLGERQERLQPGHLLRINAGDSYAVFAGEEEASLYRLTTSGSGLQLGAKPDASPRTSGGF